MSEKIRKLLKLAERNPELPIVPIVNPGVCDRGCEPWLGVFDEVWIDEYVSFDERMYFRSYEEKDAEQYFADNDEEFWDEDATPEDNWRNIREYVRTLWRKAIIVVIT